MISTYFGKLLASKLLKEIGLRIIFAALARHVKSTENTLDDEILIRVKDAFGRATEEELESIKPKRKAPAKKKTTIKK